jgi:acetyl-CoA synthetase
MSFPYQLRSEAEYHAAYARSLEDPEGFWKEVAQHFSWRKFPTRVLDWEPSQSRIEWFADGELNITENCLDRHLVALCDAPALLWEPNDPAEGGRSFTYRELHAEVVNAAAMLRAQGVQPGDRVILYLGAIPELLIAMLACARIGAIHSVVFGGFAAQALASRIQDAGARVVITCDGAYRGPKEIQLKPIVDEALRSCPEVSCVLVVRRTGSEVSMIEGRDSWWKDVLAAIEGPFQASHDAIGRGAEDPLFILYTSGSTGKPKGVVQTTAGYMMWAAYTFANVFQYQRGDVFFCTADPGWITGHTYVLYAPLLAGGTTLLFEGVPTWPDAGRLWDIVEKYRVATLYTAPTAIRSLMARGLEPFEGKDLSSLKVLGSVGEPINEEAWHWYHEHVGGGRCPVVDTWWQTETGGILMSALAGITESKPAWAGWPLPGVAPVLMDEQGKELPDGEGTGNLCIRQPWPGILRTTWGDHERFRQTYFTTYPGEYFTGDGALRDNLGRYRITGRVDDVLNVSGHRIGTAELENAINHHHAVVESAVVGFPHAVKGQGIWAFVVLEDDAQTENIDSVISATVTASIGAIARPDRIQIVPGLPKTRSGKIMRRILRKIAEGETEALGDVSTLLDPSVVEIIVAGAR